MKNQGYKDVVKVRETNTLWNSGAHTYRQTAYIQKLPSAIYSLINVWFQTLFVYNIHFDLELCIRTIS